MAQNPKSGGLSHEKVETNNFLMIVLILVVLLVGGMVEIVPLFFQKSTTEPVPGLKPYTALQVVGRDIYVREGCYNCHSQMIRPFRAETLRYGSYSLAGEFVYDRPFQWGSKRTGPDLARVGGRAIWCPSPTCPLTLGWAKARPMPTASARTCKVCAHWAHLTAMKKSPKPLTM
jgi:cytochrome c oxidase cbb3-type subunit 2